MNKKAKVHYASKKIISDNHLGRFCCDYMPCSFYAYLPGKRMSGLPDESTTVKRKVTCGNCKRTKVFKNDKWV